VAEFKDRGSKFMAHAYPIADIIEFKEKLTAIKKEHPKAVHHCFVLWKLLCRRTGWMKYYPA
jgi:putative IMPACT (imprinted ancient) family translation regulator